MSAGNQTYDNTKYYYAKGLAQGKKDFESIGLSIHGGIGGEYGSYKTELENFSQNIIKIRTKGGISFKSKDLCADISADVLKGIIKTKYMDNSRCTNTTSVSVVGNVSTKNINVSATVSSLKVNSDPGLEEKPLNDNKASVTASIVIGIKNILGKNIMPILRYNIGNYDGAAQSLGAGVIISP